MSASRRSSKRQTSSTADPASPSAALSIADDGAINRGSVLQRAIKRMKHGDTNAGVRAESSSVVQPDSVLHESKDLSAVESSMVPLPAATAASSSSSSSSAAAAAAAVSTPAISVSAEDEAALDAYLALMDGRTPCSLFSCFHS